MQLARSLAAAYDVILLSAGPAEVDARIRLAMGRQSADQVSSRIQTSGISIDESSYSAKVHGKPLDLTYTEFELLKYLVAHPGRVLTREMLRSQVWGEGAAVDLRTVEIAQAAAPAAAPAAAGKPGMTPEMLAILSAAVDSAMTELTPEMVAVISAAVDAGLDGMSHRIVEIKQSPGSGYAAAGRAEIFASHRIRPSR